MNLITAVGNENLNKKIKEYSEINVIGTDIQYQEAVIEIMEKNKEIDLLILSSILPGELNIYEFLNIIKYKNSEIEIFMILEKNDEKLENFLIAKGINNIYYNNKTTFEEIIKKIYEVENKINKSKKIIIKKNNNNKIKNKIKYIKNKIYKKIIKKNKQKNKKIISIIGAKKIGKSIFSLILSLNIKNKKILIVDLDAEENNMKTIVGAKMKISDTLKDNKMKWRKNIDIQFVYKKIYYKNNLIDKKAINDFLNNIRHEYDYIIIDIGNIHDKENIIKNSDKIIVLVEANLLGIKDVKEILNEIVHKQKNHKDNIKIIYNKQTLTSINKEILNKIFSDFEIIGNIQYDKCYNLFINTNAKYITPKIQKDYLKIAKRI